MGAASQAERPRRLLPSIQGLRALAALSVAFSHFAHDAIANGSDPRHWISAVKGFLPWDAGVDIFFVISGFVIVHASGPLFGTGWPGQKTFLRRRIARIVPLYWIMTAAFLLVLWLGRGTVHGEIGGKLYILMSFLFVPWPRPDGALQPALGLGWTLNYEMFFYLVFAAFLLLPRRQAVMSATAVLAAFVLLRGVLHVSNPQLGFWSNPIILEFCAGMALAQAVATDFRLSQAARLALPILAIAALHLAANSAPQFRVFTYGLPAFLLVAAAALTQAPATLSAPARWLARLGDASYAMYLFHPFVMRLFSVLWRKIHAHQELSGTIYVLAGLAVAQACALVINGTLERKLGALLRRPTGVTDEAVQMPGMRPDGIL